MTKLKMWNEKASFKEAEQEWDQGAIKASQEYPIQGLKQLPSMVGITPDTAKWLKWKSLYWMMKHDRDRKILRSFLRHPLKYGWNYLKSLLKDKPYKRENDFFLYGIQSLEDFAQLLKQERTLLVVGFSYCHKPFECPSGRFSADCQHDPSHPVCRQCFIGKVMNALPDQNTIGVAIPTIHSIGGKIFELIEKYPDKQLIFMITACEMTLQMFGDWGNMVGIQGIGVRLDGRICNTMKAFKLSEEGIKPGLTVVLEDTKAQMMRWVAQRREAELDP
ncbi:hypothetical protein [Parachlamydia sp. AcF125]|uniref:hypothetical protein n=1 Tax=Parachlamydia sp. AcF125 TaxID=2795736 RepID=UPI001BC8FEE5|nr:hypothetical protein [Parachlamydia sp. AcF125]MBS4167600.1 hypothetical protein [Parachlamydia sp. AcF125]